MAPPSVRTLASGIGFTEGPVIRGNGEIVVTSVFEGRLYRIADGGCEVFAETGGGPNGATEGFAGAIYVAQNGGKHPAVRAAGMTGGIQVVDARGVVAWLTQDVVSPNDLCFGPDGLLYCSDPTRRDARDDGRIWRCGPEDSEAELLCSVGWYPNGIGFGVEDDALYVAAMGERRIYRFPVDGGRLGKPEVFVNLSSGEPDGFAFDDAGNLIVCAVSFGDDRGRIQTYDRSGKLLDIFEPGPYKKYTNIALDADRRLVITASDAESVLVVNGWPHAGLPLHPFRNASREERFSISGS